MKILFTFIIMLIAVSTFADVGPINRSTQLDATGALNGPLEQWFINVKNASGGALEDGDVVVLDVTADDGYSVTTSTTAGAVPLCVLAQACASAAVCKCQTYGYKANLNFTPDQDNAVAGGQAFISESQAGKVDAITLVASGDRPIAVFYDAASATGDVEAFIMLR